MRPDNLLAPVSLAVLDCQGQACSYAFEPRWRPDLEAFIGSLLRGENEEIQAIHRAAQEIQGMLSSGTYNYHYQKFIQRTREILSEIAHEVRRCKLTPLEQANSPFLTSPQGNAVRTASARWLARFRALENSVGVYSPSPVTVQNTLEEFWKTSRLLAMTLMDLPDEERDQYPAFQPLPVVLREKHPPGVLTREQAAWLLQACRDNNLLLPEDLHQALTLRVKKSKG